MKERSEVILAVEKYSVAVRKDKQLHVVKYRALTLKETPFRLNIHAVVYGTLGISEPLTLFYMCTLVLC